MKSTPKEIIETQMDVIQKGLTPKVFSSWKIEEESAFKQPQYVGGRDNIPPDYQKAYDNDTL